MSANSAVAFLQRAKSDPVFTAELAHAGCKASRRRVAGRHGYAFTEPEFNAALTKLTPADRAEINFNTAKACCPCMGCKEDAAFA
jgi:predicted ribosomally synthesized peptide with nif11-like leader